ncbi:MAG TPA: GAF domain-containing sensor histidine kinase [Bryobacteraceae bacterium]
MPNFYQTELKPPRSTAASTLAEGNRKARSSSPPELAPELADAADVLSDQLHAQLHRLSTQVAPYLDAIESRFRASLKSKRILPIQSAALSCITFGAAARVLIREGSTALKFIEQVEYNGRRLAKLNLPPSAIVEALQEYDRLLTAKMTHWPAEDVANFQWVREQLHFCVILTLNNAYYQVREAETQAFYELFRVELESRNLEELLQRFVEVLAHVCQADAGHLYLISEPDDQGDPANQPPPMWMPLASVPRSASGKPVPVKRGQGLSVPAFIDCRGGESTRGPKRNLLLDSGWWKKYHACWSIPLAKDGRTVGVIQMGFSKYYEWLPREQELLAAAAERCLMAAEKARLMDHLAASEEQIRQLAEHMLHVEEMERRRISRELHDEAGQSLLCIRLQMELLEQNLPDSEMATKEKLRDARDLTERTILEMRRLIAALSPAVLEQLGLGAALRQLIARFQRLHPIRVKLVLARLGGLPQQNEVIVYRLVQECFNNIAKHSGARHVNISVTSADGQLKLIVEDDGVGFKIEEAFARRDSFGLSGMRERVTLLGGRFQIRSFPRTEGPNVSQDTDGGALQVPSRDSKRIKKDRGTKISIELPISRSVNHSISEPRGDSAELRRA